MKDVSVESDIFEGMKFGVLLTQNDFQKNPENNYGANVVVVSDPKARTGDRDRQDLMKQLSTFKLMGDY